MAFPVEKEEEGLINECETDDERSVCVLCCAVLCDFISNLSIEVLINNRS